MAVSSLRVPGLNTNQLANTEQTGEPEETLSTTRNRAAQCQASLVVKMPMLESRQDEAESLLAKGPVAEVRSRRDRSCAAADVLHAGEAQQ
jgi:hypothetical protein